MSLGKALGQSQVNVQPAPGVVGDFCSANPRFSVLAGPGGLIAGPLGAYVGRFAWTAYSAVDDDGAPADVNNFGSGLVAGFIHREQQGLITEYLEVASLKVPAGFPMTVMDGGDFWVINSGATTAYPGMKAYARYADGLATFGATGAPGTASATGSIGAGAGASAVGTIVDNLFTATGTLTGTFVAGGVLTGTNVATGTAIVSQVLPLIAGEALGGLGRYTVNKPGQNVASTLITESWGVFTAASALSGTFGPGDTLTGPGGSSDPVATGTVIISQLTGTPGGLGTYVVNLTQTSTSATITAGTSIETKWYCRSTGAAGELVKISSQPQG